MQCDTRKVHTFLIYLHNRIFDFEVPEIIKIWHLSTDLQHLLCIFCATIVYANYVPVTNYTRYSVQHNKYTVYFKKCCIFQVSKSNTEDKKWQRHCRFYFNTIEDTTPLKENDHTDYFRFCGK